MAAIKAERWLSEHGLAVETSAVSSEPETPSTPQATPAHDPKPNLEETFHYGGQALRHLYHESPRLIMVKYVSPTCGPCHALKPILNKVAAEFADRIHVVEIDIAAEPEIAEAAGVTGTPTVQFFKDKQKVGQLMGVKPKSAYRETIASHL